MSINFGYSRILDEIHVDIINPGDIIMDGNHES